MGNSSVKVISNLKKCILFYTYFNDTNNFRDDTIISGDSLGHVCFWEGTFGTMKQKLGAHDADVLCLASNIVNTFNMNFSLFLYSSW
jgi:hypothetical protein